MGGSIFVDMELFLSGHLFCGQNKQNKQNGHHSKTSNEPCCVFPFEDVIKARQCLVNNIASGSDSFQKKFSNTGFMQSLAFMSSF